MRSIFWFRNDLRLRDNPALHAACAAADELACVFVVDPALLAAGAGARRGFLAECVEALAVELAERGHRLVLLRGAPERVLPRLLEDTQAELLCWNRSTTPSARVRDRRVERAAEARGVRVRTHKAGVVFEASEIRSGKGTGYAVYSPYKRAWRQRLQEQAPERLRLPRFPKPLSMAGKPAEIGMIPGELSLEKALLELRAPASDAPQRELMGGEERAKRRLRSFLKDKALDYSEMRDRPDIDGTSKLSPYLRFGAISALECVQRALETATLEPKSAAGAQKWVDELIWRDFYAAILEENPHVVGGNYRAEYDVVRWEDSPEHLDAWKRGLTGFPIVDAGMRQLFATGWMHNRVRMIVASFLTKDLGIHWLEGERWFSERLVDYDPASNNGGWQWSASTGTDAQPWFRIFNPTRQALRFDPEGEYVRRWVPELRDTPGKDVHEPEEGLFRGDYPPPIVDHARARERTLARFQVMKKG